MTYNSHTLQAEQVYLVLVLSRSRLPAAIVASDLEESTHHRVLEAIAEGEFCLPMILLSRNALARSGS